MSNPEYPNVPTGTEPVSLPGGFISEPSAFSTAPPSLRHVIKLMYRPTVRNGDVALEFSTDAFVVDFGAVDVNDIDPSRMAVDCDLLKRITQTYPDQLRQLVSEMQQGTAEAVERAVEIASKIGLTEDASIKAGGGVAILLVAAAAALGGWACGGANRHKATSPAATTTPSSTRIPIRSGGGEGPQPQ